MDNIAFRCTSVYKKESSPFWVLRTEERPIFLRCAQVWQAREDREVNIPVYSVDVWESPRPSGMIDKILGDKPSGSAQFDPQATTVDWVARFSFEAPKTVTAWLGYKKSVTLIVKFALAVPDLSPDLVPVLSVDLSQWLDWAAATLLDVTVGQGSWVHTYLVSGVGKLSANALKIDMTWRVPSAPDLDNDYALSFSADGTVVRSFIDVFRTSMFEDSCTPESNSSSLSETWEGLSDQDLGDL